PRPGSPARGPCGSDPMRVGEVRGRRSGRAWWCRVPALAARPGLLECPGCTRRKRVLRPPREPQAGGGASGLPSRRGVVYSTIVNVFDAICQPSPSLLHMTLVTDLAPTLPMV